MPTAEAVSTVNVIPAKPSSAKPQPARREAATPPAEARKPRAAAEPRPPPIAAPAPEPVAVGPAPSCGPRAGVRYHICMERECGSADFSGHPACLAWKKEAR